MKSIVFVALLTAAGATPAQDSGFVAAPALPIATTPAPSYPHEDPAAMAQVTRESRDPRANQRVLAKLDAAIERDPSHVGLRASRAHHYAMLGQGDLSEADYARAMMLARDNPVLKRHVSWSWGWARLALDDPREALVHWRDAERLHGGLPHWVPYTYALALWQLDRRDLAVAYYDAAARSFPLKWGNRAGVRKSTALWRTRERELLDEVYVEWAARKGVQ